MTFAKIQQLITKQIGGYLTIKGILEQLPKSKFLQVHKSYIVNIQMVNTIEGNTLHIGSTKITIGLNWVNEVMDKLLKDRIIKR